MKRAVSISIISVVLAAFLFPALSYAQVQGTLQTQGTQGTTQTRTVQTIQNPLEADTIPGLIADILDVVITIGFFISVFFIIYAGFLFVTAQGNDEKLSKAKTTFLWTIVGVAILLGAKVLANVVCGTLNEISDSPLRCERLR